MQKAEKFQKLGKFSKLKEINLFFKHMLGTSMNSTLKIKITTNLQR